MLSQLLRARPVPRTQTGKILNRNFVPIGNVSQRAFASKGNDVDIQRKTPKRRQHKRRSGDIDLSDPFDAVDHIRQLQDRFFDQALRNTPLSGFRNVLGDPFSWLARKDSRRPTDELGFPELGSFAPQLALDVKEHDDHFEVTVDSPGLGKDQVSVQIEDDVLSILAETGDKSEKTEKDEEGNVTMHRMERHSGSASRSIRLPDNADTENINAKMDRGVLTLNIPKREPSTSNRRNIKIE